MRHLNKLIAACLAGLVIVTPATADDDDRFRGGSKRQKESDKRLREFQKKQQEWLWEQQKKEAEWLRERRKKEAEWFRDQRKWEEEQLRDAWKQQREFDREQRKQFEKQFREQGQWFGGYPGPTDPTPSGWPGYSAPQHGYPGAQPLYPPGSGPMGYFGQPRFTPTQPFPFAYPRYRFDDDDDDDDDD
jgi:hypothetical protein